LLNRIWEGDGQLKNRGRDEDDTHIAIDTMDDVFWRQRRYLRVDFCEEGRKFFDEVFPFSFCLTIYGFYIYIRMR
jgi:hypothetical protein